VISRFCQSKNSWNNASLFIRSDALLRWSKRFSEDWELDR